MEKVKYNKCEHPTKTVTVSDSGDEIWACPNCLAYNFGSSWQGALPASMWECNKNELENKP